MQLLVLLMTVLYVHSIHSKYFGIQQKSRKCLTDLEESANGIGAGAARNISFQCYYDNKSPENMYFKFSWNPPLPTGTNVSSYRIRIIYHGSVDVCFVVPPTQTTVVFNQSMGLVYGCGFDLYVTPSPIVYVDESFREKSVQVFGCPIAPKLLALPNIMAKTGSSSSFVVVFDIEPIPSPTIKWYFSHDKVYCRNPVPIENHRTNIIFSKDMRILRVVNITKEDVGCYTVSADNTIGRTDKQRAYLELNFTMPASEYSSHDIKGPLFGSLVGMIIVALFCVLIITHIRKKITVREPEESLLTGAVYVSHCTEENNSKRT